MSSIAIANAASTALPTVNFRSHGHMHGKKSSELESQSESSVGSVGQMPVGASQGLLGNMLQSLQQVIGAPTGTITTAATSTSAATATTAATATSAAGTAAATAATAASPNVTQDLSGFLHSLFQVLRQEGTAGASAAPAATGGASAATGVGQYQGSLASSLQTLIQQIGSNGPTTPAISNLESSFNSLVQGLGGSASTTTASNTVAGTTSTQSSTAPLQNFLNNLLQNLQTNGLQAANLSGTSVNAKV